MNRFAYAKCPYCGKPAKKKIEDDYNELHALICEDCNKLFAVMVTVELQVRSFKCERE